jgi:hypothetical protein
MRQALHVFQKDARYLWGEICLLVALAVIFARTGAQWAEALLAVGAAFLIARLIHAEPIAGDHQFWITRPYRWRSLLAAKILFILAFVNLPIFLAQLYILIHGGFSLASDWSGLLWSQVLAVLAIWLPVGALAAMTPGIVPFIFSAFVLITTAFLFQQSTIVHLSDTAWPVGVEWVRNSIAVIAVAAATLSVLYMQYRNRKTLFSRIFALGAVALVATAYLYLPVAWAMALQSRLSGRLIEFSSVQFLVVSNAEKHFPMPSPNHVPADLSLVATGIPDDLDLQFDAVSLSFQASDGRTWQANVGGANRKSGGASAAAFDVPFLMAASFFNEESQQPVTLRVSLYLTLFGNSRTKTIPLQGEPLDVMDGLQCYLDKKFTFIYFTCRSAFHWPARLVYVQQGQALSSLGQLISYSPFPSGINLDDSIETRSTSEISAYSPQVTITVKEPLAHFRRDFEIGNIRLADLTTATKGLPLIQVH